MRKETAKGYKKITVREDPQFRAMLTSNIVGKMLSLMDRQSINVPWELGNQAVQDSFACIEEHRAFRLYGSNHMKRTFHYIQEVGFPRLHFLMVGSLGIESLEVLPRINLPILKQLWICNNKIMSLKPLRKVHYSKLTHLSIKNNENKDFAVLCKCDFPVLNYYSNQFSYKEDGPQDLTSILKLNSKKIKTLSSGKFNGVNQDQVKNQICQKYPKTNITLRPN